MPYVHYVAVLGDVLLAFETQRALGAGVGFGASFEQLIPANCFRADKVFFQVGMDRARSLRRRECSRGWSRHGTRLLPR